MGDRRKLRAAEHLTVLGRFKRLRASRASSNSPRTALGTGYSASRILARITGYATGATNPEDLFFAPIFAVRNLMQKTGSKIGDYDLIEANEAFASQALADGQELGWDWNRVNVNGGAIALGHPIGASGARVLTTLLYAMQDRGARTGLATLCLGGGDAVALSVERVD